ncbi:hypothetical protein HH214_02035 [Mucilaginibacter robiniae]|uniref:XRE family transcriptional regulator n=1 Tax=Mucilaginibacter robiniae TaxID=2728022 RepID=A0A7L5DXK2_9SPHI|nr:hypothetical protein [Mucilaginibacter robiniae]QJD94739.1 hypothetical protein HH214_02035 [Mucilaginibacter robiniae]
MTESKFKYRINQLLNTLSVTDYRKAIRIIPKQLGVSEKNLANYRNIKMDDKQDIPHEKVAMLEKLFNVHPGELQNFVLVMNPITEIIQLN